MNTSSLRRALAFQTCGLLAAMALGCTAEIDDADDDVELAEDVDASESGVNGGCPNGGITVFEDANYEGRAHSFCAGSIVDLSQQHGGLNANESWNDKISSVRAFGTYDRSIRLRVYQDANYVGSFSRFPHTFVKNNGIASFDWYSENDHMSSLKIQSSENLLVNPGFEDIESYYYPERWHGWYDNWDFETGWVDRADSGGYNGTHFARVIHSFANQCLTQNRAAKPGEHFKASVWVRRHSGVVGGQALTLSFFEAGNSKAIAKVKDAAGGSTGWNKLSVSKTAPPNTVKVKFAIGACDKDSWSSAATYDFDQARLVRD